MPSEEKRTTRVTPAAFVFSGPARPGPIVVTRTSVSTASDASQKRLCFMRLLSRGGFTDGR
jgi:hypothetical protein